MLSFDPDRPPNEERDPHFRQHRKAVPSVDSAHAQRNGLGVGRQPHRLGAGDDLLVVQVEQVLVEPLHASFAGGDVVAQIAEPVFQDVLGRDRPAAEDLHRRPAARRRA